MREPRNPVSTEAKYLAAILEELRRLNQIMADEKGKSVKAEVSGQYKDSKPGSGKVEMKEPANEKQVSSSPKRTTKKKSK